MSEGKEILMITSHDVDEASLNGGVRLKFTYVYEDFFVPQRGWRLDVQVLIGWGVVMATMGGIWLALRSQGAATAQSTSDMGTIIRWVFPVGLISVVLFDRRRRERLHRRSWEKSNQAKSYDVTFSTAGVLWRNDAALLQLQWTNYDHFEERADGFRLYPTGLPDQPVLIPARSIPRTQVAILRELFRRHASEAKGFPVQPPRTIARG